MPLFVCDRCHAIDNSACGGNYWDRLIAKEKTILCAECYTGTWHGQFSKTIYIGPPKQNPNDFIYLPKQFLSMSETPEPNQLTKRDPMIVGGGMDQGLARSIRRSPSIGRMGAMLAVGAMLGSLVGAAGGAAMGFPIMPGDGPLREDKERTQYDEERMRKAQEKRDRKAAKKAVKQKPV